MIRSPQLKTNHSIKEYEKINIRLFKLIYSFIVIEIIKLNYLINKTLFNIMRKSNALIFSIVLTCIFTIDTKMTAQPDLEWEKSFGGTDHDFGYEIQQTSDGGYIISGRSDSNDGDLQGNNGGFDIWVIKLDFQGNLEWQKNYGGSENESTSTIIQTTDGGYIIGSGSSSIDGDVGGNNGVTDAWVVKLDVDGNIEWEQNYGGTNNESVKSLQQTTDGGFIFAATTTSEDGDVGGNNGIFDFWVVKLGNEGNIEWEQNLGGSGVDAAESIQQTIDGGYIVVGTSTSNNGDVGENNGNDDCWITKLDIEGNIEWGKVYGGSEKEYAYAIQQTPDEGYIIAGGSYSTDGDVGGNNGDVDYWILKLDSFGNLHWEKNYGGSNSDRAEDIKLTSDGGYIVTGWSASDDGDVGGNKGGFDCWVLKLGITGTIDWQKNYGGSNEDYPSFIQQTSDDGYISIVSSNSNDGDLSGNNGDYDIWIFKLSQFSVGVQNTNSTPNFTISPNPSNGEFTVLMDDFTSSVDIEITDIEGHSIYTKNDLSGMLKINSIPRGSYYITVKNSKNSFTKKLIIL